MIKPSDIPRLGAIAVVLRPGEVLLVQRGKQPDAGLWGFPGGHVEWGETALDAALRELREETGILATARGYLTNVDVLRHDARGGVAAHYLLAAVLCDDPSGQPQAGDDARDAAWFPFEAVERSRLALSARVLDVLTLARAETGF